MFYLFPPLIPFVLIANGVWDAIIFTIAIKVLGLAMGWKDYFKHWIKVVFFGFLADVIGALFALPVMFVPSSNFIDRITDGLGGFKFTFESLLVSVPALLISSFLIYYFNKRFSFKDREPLEAHRLSLILAIFTAPITFILPVYRILDFFGVSVY